MTFDGRIQVDDVTVCKYAIIVLILFCALGFASPQQQVGDMIRVQTTLVSVPVMVSDPVGGAVRGLAGSDFTIWDDGARRQAAFFADTEEPIQIVLMLDTSKSTTTVLDRIRKAASEFVSQLRPRDEAMVVSFDAEFRVLGRWSSDGREIKLAIRKAEVGDFVGTRMQDAVVRVVDKNLRSSRGRKAIILLTDGQDYGSTASAEDMVRAVVDSGTVAYPVFYRVNRYELARKLFGVSLSRSSAAGAMWEEDERAAAVLLRKVAEDSAGSFYQSEMTDLKKTFAQVAEQLRHQYLLAFYPDPARVDGNEHALRVTVSRPDLVVRSRGSYRASASPEIRPPSPD